MGFPDSACAARINLHCVTEMGDEHIKDEYRALRWMCNSFNKFLVKYNMDV